MRAVVSSEVGGPPDQGGGKATGPKEVGKPLDQVGGKAIKPKEVGNPRDQGSGKATRSRLIQANGQFGKSLFFSMGEFYRLRKFGPQPWTGRAQMLMLTRSTLRSKEPKKGSKWCGEK